MANSDLPKYFFYYDEDWEQTFEKDSCLDVELSAIAGKNIYIGSDELSNRFFKMKSSNVLMYHTSKSNKDVYSKLGELSPLWIKDGKWCLSFYPFIEKIPELRLILDTNACSLRYKMFFEIIFKLI